MMINVVRSGAHPRQSLWTRALPQTAMTRSIPSRSAQSAERRSARSDLAQVAIKLTCCIRATTTRRTAIRNRTFKIHKHSPRSSRRTEGRGTRPARKPITMRIGTRHPSTRSLSSTTPSRSRRHSCPPSRPPRPRNPERARRRFWTRRSTSRFARRGATWALTRPRSTTVRRR